MNSNIATSISEIFTTQPTARFFSDETKQEVKAITWTINSTKPPEMWNFYLHLTDSNHLAVEVLDGSEYPTGILEALTTTFPELTVSTYRHEGCRHCGSPLTPLGLSDYESTGSSYCTSNDCLTQ